MPFTEFKTVEKPIIDWLVELGWKYVPPNEMVRDADEPFHLPSLKRAIIKFNSVIRNDSDVDRVINQLRVISNNIYGNSDFFDWVKGEKSIILRQGETAQTIRLIDYDNPGNNEYVVTNQFKFSGYENVRFDIVLMVNGIPLVVIEAKAPAHQLLDYHEGIKQILRYNEEAPQFFKYLALACATDGINFRYDWITQDKYFQWKSREYEDPLENSIKNLFRREFFLDFVQNFIVFEKEMEQVRKKIAMYQQVIAANKIVSRVLEGKVRSGLIWHTQGSGKSLTMLLAAWKLKKAPQMDNPTILLIEDRIHLEKQLWGSFSNVDFPYTSKAESVKDLRDKLMKDSREVIITTIQKFEDIENVLSERKNIIIFVDEAHRSQYGKLAMRMRKAFPNAFIFGFTGTPIEKSECGKSTFRTFCPTGEIYLDKYGIKQSIEDGATVRLVYQARLPRAHVDKETLDREFYQITAGLTEEEQDRVLEKSATLRTWLKSKDRMDSVAKDIAEHFKAHIEPNGFKAQLVAVDREGCALYKEALDKYLPPEYSSVIYTKGLNDPGLLRKYHMDSTEQFRVARIDFQKKGTNPRILIVTDMLLTGFDAPIEQVMYLDKPLRDHKLLQAIARTNRPYHGKEAGIIFDYVGIFNNLVKALNFQEQDIEGVAYNYDILKEEFDRTINSLLKMFRDVPRDGSRSSILQFIAILKDEETFKEFKGKLSKLKMLYETLAPDPMLFKYMDDYSWLIENNEAYNKFRNRNVSDLADYEEKTKDLIREKLIIDKLEKNLPTFDINSEYIKKLNERGYSTEEKVMEMRQALEYTIRINLETNPIYETLGERMERILKSTDKSKLINDMQQLINEVVAVEEHGKKLGATKEEFALLNVVKKHLPSVKETETVGYVKDLRKSLGESLFPGWYKKVKVYNETEEKVFQHNFEKYSTELKTEEISRMSTEMMKFLVKYNP
ncbi:MAG: HsdR family type I site-specific deoxyribonuclease [Candidatus Methanomethylicaceae archaeon]|jgi:type I restriction enzyme R subunit